MLKAQRCWKDFFLDFCSPFPKRSKLKTGFRRWAWKRERRQYILSQAIRIFVETLAELRASSSPLHENPGSGPRLHQSRSCNCIVRSHARNNGYIIHFPINLFIILCQTTSSAKLPTKAQSKLRRKCGTGLRHSLADLPISLAPPAHCSGVCSQVRGLIHSRTISTLHLIYRATNIRNGPYPDDDQTSYPTIRT